MRFTTGLVVARNCFSTALTCRMSVGLKTMASLTSVVMVVVDMGCSHTCRVTRLSVGLSWCRIVMSVTIHVWTFTSNHIL